MSMPTSVPRPCRIAILMSASGRFLVCRECHLSLEFPVGALYADLTDLLYQVEC